LFKFGGEWNRTSTTQIFVGFAGGRMAFSSVSGFINFVNQGSHYIECSGGGSGVAPGFSCPVGETITGPVLLYLQQSGVGTNTVEQAGTQTLTANEFALYLQDTWKPSPKLTVNYGLRWEAQVQPSTITPPSTVFFSPWIDSTVNGHTFPSDGNIPSYKKMFQPRLGIAWDPQADGRQVFRLNAGLYYARISVEPGERAPKPIARPNAVWLEQDGRVHRPAFDSLLRAARTPFQPDVSWTGNFQSRTLNLTVGYDARSAGT
jgi:outer membrane receptor protein involved in Fe transport